MRETAPCSPPRITQSSAGSLFHPWRRRRHRKVLFIHSSGFRRRGKGSSAPVRKRAPLSAAGPLIAWSRPASGAGIAAHGERTLQATVIQDTPRSPSSSSSSSRSSMIASPSKTLGVISFALLSHESIRREGRQASSESFPVRHNLPST
ncbi:hypothetical protein K431DRAFT_62058 [Polychaeton citri CBS 116435]|uniref:Uncharacterized protein n=1 Tax=Polychaeton citri CBS 116435 TaxID=1314669 RepID=A0A9P4QBP3_9PEZI|nr:hypothetical protein K431DRAFT_62058 [Polychaeton citri CBS 116435]